MKLIGKAIDHDGQKNKICGKGCEVLEVDAAATWPVRHTNKASNVTVAMLRAPLDVNTHPKKSKRRRRHDPELIKFQGFGTANQ